MWLASKLRLLLEWMTLPLLLTAMQLPQVCIPTGQRLWGRPHNINSPPAAMASLLVTALYLLQLRMCQQGLEGVARLAFPVTVAELLPLRKQSRSIEQNPRGEGPT